MEVRWKQQAAQTSGYVPDISTALDSKHTQANVPIKSNAKGVLGLVSRKKYNTLVLRPANQSGKNSKPVSRSGWQSCGHQPSRASLVGHKGGTHVGGGSH